MTMDFNKFKELADKYFSDISCEELSARFNQYLEYRLVNERAVELQAKMIRYDESKHSPEIGVHATHCCFIHGCKYGDEDCPVESGLIKQAYPCECCSYDYHST